MNKTLSKTLLIIAASLTLAISASQAADPVDFTREVKPILESACLSCHGPEKPKGDLSLHTRTAAIKGGDSGTSLVPGDPEESLLYTLTILPPDDDDIMPPKGDPLSKVQTEILRRWIEAGAEWPIEVELEQTQRIDFIQDIQPILEFNCVACHREGHAKGGLQLNNQESAFAGGNSGHSIVPGKSSASLIYTSTILPDDHDDIMPPAKKGGPLDKSLTDLLRHWIDQGAKWPSGITLKPKKADNGPSVVDMELVTQIHAMIVANTAEKTEAEMKRYTEVISGTKVQFEMIPIPSGSFVMGSPSGEVNRKDGEGPQVEIQLSPFWIGKCEVTWNEYDLFTYPEEMKRFQKVSGNMVENPLADAVTKPTKPYVEMSFGMGKDGYPAISMTHHAANKYCEWLSAKTGHFYRLPTEAEWEYACRAGTKTAYSFGNSADDIDDYAWHADNSDFKYQKVGKKKPNPWGLHDMHGNVAEWVIDQYAAETYLNYSKLDSVVDPWVKSTTPYPHSVRGGSWDDFPEYLRSAARRGSDPLWKMQDPQLPKSIWYLTDAQFLGFRVVRPLHVASPVELSKYWTNEVERD
ncbi:MAG: Hercynine oxygenase [Verrucomicrobia subdivision 3 bacterium]|nr:Hercynine oxygenase [Limisphaerales bacterium]MCS1415291.1 Hercynine oxygenase [Limisphaerales bacterium]